MQMMLFELEPSVHDVNRRVNEIHEKTERVRKSIYAKHGELAKMYLEVRHELDILKEAICRGK